HVALPQVADILPAMERAVEEIRNHADVPPDPQLLVGRGPQALRDRGHQVRLIDRECDNLRIRRIAADERDVGAVQGGDDARRHAAVRADDLAREETGRRVRDGIVRVDDVEAELARNLDDLVRQRQQVLRLPEERIGRRQHLVKRQPRLELAEPERRLRADEVDLVTAPGQRLAELGGDDAAAAHRGVTDDADVHELLSPLEDGAFWTRHSRSRWGRSTGSRMTNPSAKSTPARTPNCASRLSMSVMKRGDVSRVWTPPAVG